MQQLTWWCLLFQLVVAGSMATVGSIDLQWWWQDRSERLLRSAGMLCWCVSLVLMVGAVGLAFPYPLVWHAVLPLRAVLIGCVAAVFLTTLGELVKLRGIRVAVVASLILPVVFMVFGFTGSLVFVVPEGEGWPWFKPLGQLLISGSVLLVAGYSVTALVFLTGIRRMQLTVAIVTAAGLLTIAIVTGPGLLAEAMTTLWTVPIGLLLAWWCSARVLTLQGSLKTAVSGWAKAEQVAQHQARHDPLTGLPNLAAAAETL